MLPASACSNFLPKHAELNTCFFLCFDVFTGCVYCNLLRTTDEGCFMVSEMFASL